MSGQTVFIMIYILKHLVRLVLYFLLIAWVIEVIIDVLSLKEATTIYSAVERALTSSKLFWLNLIDLRLTEITLVAWTFWIFSKKIYLILLGLTLLILYYNRQGANVKEPNVAIMNAKENPAVYDHRKQKETKKAVAELQNSPQYANYLLNKRLGTNKKFNDDETVAELIAKEQELF